jgi:ADP-ribose pyrophosphatase YjhB (NUDIX family)
MIDLKEIEAKEKDFDKEIKKLKNEFSENNLDTSVKWEKTVGIIITKENKILMVKRGEEPFKGTWTLPGGHIEKDESDSEAAIREAKEETSLKINPKYFGSYEESFEELGWFAIVSIFEAKTVKDFDSSKVDKKEVLDIGWFSVEEITDLRVGFEHKKIINEFLGLI